jgi:hypothetical protein
MLTNYVKQFSIRTYANSLNWSFLTGFEQYVRDGTTKYYLFDYGRSNCAVFDSQWTFQNYTTVVPNTFTAKCVGNYLYLSSETYLYKADPNLNIFQYSQAYPSGDFRAIQYDSNSLIFYITSQGQSYLNVFDMTLARLRKIPVNSG